MRSSAAPEAFDLVAHALADGTRRRLLRLVRDGERPAGDLAAACPEMSRPAVSQHLRVLHSAGLVEVRADGNRRLYRARTEGLTEVWQFIDGPIMRGTFTVLDPPHRLVFTFGWEHNAPGEPLAPGSTIVEVTLEPEGDGTVLLLRHTDMPGAAAAEHAQGWAYFLTDRLVAAASGR